MSTTIRFLGHGAFQILTAGRSILIDPFLTGNPRAAESADSIHADTIIVSHGHGDHIGDTIAIAERTGALVIANYEIATWLQKKGVRRTHDMNTGGRFHFDGLAVKLTPALHGSMLPDGSYGGCANGVLLSTDAGKIYHACDTALFSDMTLIGDEILKAAILPIGDNYTMGPDDALKAVDFLRPEIVIPAHYNTFPAIAQDGAAWAETVRARTNANPVLLEPGEQLSL